MKGLHIAVIPACSNNFYSLPFSSDSQLKTKKITNLPNPSTSR
jgi:hypothetical protein